MIKPPLREYQGDGIEQTYNAFREGHKRVIYWLATGGGKSRTFSSVVHDTVMLGTPVVIAVKRRSLISQASANLDEWKIPHGVYMSKHRRFRPQELVQVCSIDTIHARNLYPHNDKVPLVIIDESHDVTPTGTKYTNFFDAYPNSHFIGFTATPFGDNTLWDAIVHPIEAHELRDQGFLTDVKMFVPNVIDVTNVKIKRNGDYDEKELLKASSDSKIIGDFVRDWKLYSQWRPTVLFAVNVEHSKIITKAFNDEGISAVHADATTKSHERVRLIDNFVRGKIQILCSVNIFSTGLDIPSIGAIQICRPTQSLIWHLQGIGRGLRPSPATGKENCIIIDNAGNLLRHGSPYRVNQAHIGKREKRDPDEEDITIRRCKKCNYVFEAKERQCPECGHTNPPVERKIKHEDGKLIEYNMTEEERNALDKKSIMNDTYKLKNVAIMKGFKKNWIYYSLKKKYGIDKLAKVETLVHEALNDYGV